MVKKYIVELESGTHIFVLGPEGITHIGEPDVVYETVDGMQIGDAVINAKPYTEPDLERVKKEAYQKGYETGYEDGYNEPGKNQQEAYQRGLSDAWEAARKIAVIPYDDEKIFGATGWHIFMKCAVSEVIEKLKAYEQKQDAEIKVGDEVIPRETEYDTMIVTRLWKDDYDSDCIDAIGFDGRISSFLVSRVSKTGKHYEIAAVLEKMRGEQDG